jgi:hypothetical protein
MDPDTGMINDEFEKGVLYDWAELPESVRAVGRAQRTPAVHCSWMQNLAFFWLYRRTEPMKLEYNEQLRKIKVTSEQVTKFKAMMREFPSSSRFISFIDLQERFLRVVLSPDDLRNSTARVTIPFHAKYGIYEGSKGFQQKLFHDLVSTTRLKIRHVSMSTYYRDLDEEDGTLSLLVSSINGPHRLPSLTKLRTTIQQVADDAAASLAGQGCVMDCSGVTVQQFSSPLVFLSTRFDWIEGPSSSRIDQIKRLGESAGLNVITGDTGSRRSLEEFVPTIRDKNSITDVISELIRHCSTFIQIIPIDVLRGWKGVSTRGDEGTLNWLLFEFGAAQALRLPCEILVDVRNAEADIGGWQRVLKVGT